MHNAMSPNFLLKLSAQGGLAADIPLALQQGASVSHVDLSGYSVLHMAALSGNPAAIVALLDAGADIEIEGEIGKTPLQVSVQEGRMRSAAALMERGADASVLWSDGSNVLHWIAVAGESSLVGLAIAHGANINGRSRAFHAPLVEAARHEPADGVNALLEHGANLGHLKGVELKPAVAAVVAAWRARSLAQGA